MTTKAGGSKVINPNRSSVFDGPHDHPKYEVAEENYIHFNVKKQIVKVKNVPAGKRSFSPGVSQDKRSSLLNFMPAATLYGNGDHGATQDARWNPSKKVGILSGLDPK